MHATSIASCTSYNKCNGLKDALQSLMEIVRIKPEVNQVNLTSCCHMPEDLVSYAKGNYFIFNS